jgi:hypothetical protein
MALRVCVNYISCVLQWNEKQGYKKEAITLNIYYIIVFFFSWGERERGGGVEQIDWFAFLRDNSNPS